MSVRTRKDLRRRASLVVVKVGSNVLADAEGRITQDRIQNLADHLVALRARDVSSILVTSGAIATGLAELGLAKRPKSLPQLQAAAAVGQSRLMRSYSEALARHNVLAGQVLLARSDFADRTRYLNIRHSLRALLRLGVLPIINENDSTSTEEITFGENDLLSALVTNLTQASLLVMLTTVPGLERETPEGPRCVDLVERVDDDVLALVRSDRSPAGTGGMATKLQAARITTSAGEACVVADGRVRDVLTRILDGEQLGTLFLPVPGRRMSGRKRWLASAHIPAGSITVDQGARNALIDKGTSLLPSGVLSVSGPFPTRSLVTVHDEEGRELARGLVNYSADDVEKMRGLTSAQIARALGPQPCDEIIHRDDLVLTAPPPR